MTRLEKNTHVEAFRTRAQCNAQHFSYYVFIDECASRHGFYRYNFEKLFYGCKVFGHWRRFTPDANFDVTVGTPEVFQGQERKVQ